jgi:hypothetical protein
MMGIEREPLGRKALRALTAGGAKGRDDGFDLAVDLFEDRPGFRSGGASWDERGSHVEACHPIDGWSQP